MRIPSFAVATPGFFYVTKYGAKGDGTTDDTAAIQSTMNAAVAAGGGVVFFPAGLYKMVGSTSITTSGGNPSLLFLGPGGNAAQILVDGSATTTPFTVIEGSSQSASFEFRDLNFIAPTGNVASTTRNALSVIVMTSASLFSMMTVRRCMFNGIWSDLDMVQWNGAYALAEDVGIYACSQFITGVNVYSAMLSFQGCYRATARRIIGLDESSTGLASDGAGQYGIYFTAPAASSTYPAPVGDFLVEDAVVDENFGINQIQFGAGTFPVGTKWATATARNVFGNIGGASNSNLIGAVLGASLLLEHINPTFYAGSKQSITINGIDQGRLEGVIAKNGVAEIVIDNPIYVPTFIPASGSIEIVDSNFNTYTTPATPVAVFVTNNGLRSRLRVSQAAIIANTLVKPVAPDGSVDQLATTDDARYVLGVALDAAAGSGVVIRVVEMMGQTVQVKTDGSASLSPGSVLTASATSGGRVKATTTPGASTVGLSESTVAATADLLCTFNFGRSQY